MERGKGKGNQWPYPNPRVRADIRSGRREGRDGGDQAGVMAAPLPKKPIQSMDVEFPQRSSTAAGEWERPARLGSGLNLPRPGPSPSQIRKDQPTAGWESVTLKVTNLPPQTTTRDLHRHFSGMGNLIRIGMHDTQYGKTAYLTFTPIPEGDFWTRPGENIRDEIVVGPNTFTIYVNCLHPSPKFITNPKTRERILERVVLLPEMLKFGVLTGENEMASMRTIPSPGHGRLWLNFDTRIKKLNLGFSYRVQNPRAKFGQVAGNDALDGVRHFKAEISFNTISKIYSLEFGQNRTSLVIVLPSPPLFFKKRDDIDHTHTESDTWGEHDSWRRITDLMYDTDWLHESSIALVKSEQDVDIGRWTVYQVYLSASETEKWENLRGNLLDFNVKIINTSPLRFKTVSSKMPDFWPLLHHYAAQEGNLAVLGSDYVDYHLPFAVRYQLEACFSQGVLIEQNITTEFLAKLAQLARTPRYMSNPAADLLMYVSDSGKPVYDPMSIFNDRRAMTHRPIFRLPNYCEWVRKVTVTPTTIYLSSPTPETTNRVLRQYRQYADRFLRVQFTEEKPLGAIFEDYSGKREAIFDRVYTTMKNGIYIAGRHYEFLAYGNSQIRSSGAYFFHSTSDLTCEDIRSWMGDFKHIRVVAKYSARMGQCLSTTRSVPNLPAGVIIKEIPDIENGEYCFTDGVGKISPILAKDIANSLRKYDNSDIPSAFQFRLGGSKGLLVTWPQPVNGPTKASHTPLNFNDIHLRPSQKKFVAGYSKGVEIIQASEFSVATLNRQIITILSSLGIEARVFVDMAMEQNRKYKAAMMDPKVALDILHKHSDPSSTNEILETMIKSGFMNSKEPCVMALLSYWIGWAQKQLKEKARLIVEKGAFLFGCVDETNTLRGWYEPTDGKPGSLPQIFVQVPESAESRDYVVKTGICVVGRNPSLHPGDLRVVEAIDVPQLHHLRNVVVFPANGDRDIPSMCSGGDLDGDDFFVLWDPRLCPPQRNVSPMNHDGAKPKELDRDVEISDIHRFFVEYMKNNSLGMIATTHLAHADNLGAQHPKSIRLAHLHSTAVDYVKSGQPAILRRSDRADEYPHYMERKAWPYYTSTTAVGQIYDYMDKIQVNVQYNNYFDARIMQRYDLSEDELLTARAFKSQYDTLLMRLMRQHDIDTEFEIFTTFALSKPRVGSDYKRHEVFAEARAALHDRFINAATREAGDRQGQPFRRLVAACYRVTWEHIQQAKIHNEPASFITFPWAFYRDLCSIATETGKRGAVKVQVKGQPAPQLELKHWPTTSKVWDKDITDIIDRFLRREEDERLADEKNRDKDEYKIDVDSGNVILEEDAEEVEEEMGSRRTAAISMMKAMQYSIDAMDRA